MNDQTATVETTEVHKTVIRPDLNRYVSAKSASGKKTNRIDDFVARTLSGKTLEVVKQGAILFGINVAKWEALNAGQQRMLIGNALRSRLTAKKVEDQITESAITDVYGEPEAEGAAAAAHEAAVAARAEKAAKAAEAKALKAQASGPTSAPETAASGTDEGGEEEVNHAAADAEAPRRSRRK